jgi:hypothetical protein
MEPKNDKACQQVYGGKTKANNVCLAHFLLEEKKFAQNGGNMAVSTIHDPSQRSTMS